MNRTVLTRYGRVAGVPGAIPKFTVFRGVPYAKPPVGELRWRAPEPCARWEGVRACDAFPPAAMQPAQQKGAFYEREFFQAGYEVSEDCLYLNVWADLEKKDLPVLFWIHGGAYNHGFGHEMEFDGEGFLKRGVVLVTINYRVGAPGFFAHPGLTERDGHSGNYGLMDQIAALRWVRENIFAFGGDPDNVTVFGQSAGGGSVAALMAAPLAKGLFRRAIIMSAGTPLRSLGGGYSQGDAEQAGLDLAALAGAGLDDLYAMDAPELLRLSRVITERGGLRFRPCVDGSVLPEDPGAAFARGAVNGEGLMIGSVTGDATLFGDPGENPNETCEGASASVAKLRLGQGHAPAYVYHFSRDIPGDDHPGAFHSSELWYVFSTLSRSDRPFEALDYGISLRMADWWANFARTGDPGDGFPAFTQANPSILEIGEEISVARIGDRPLADRISDEIIGRVHG